MHPHHPPLGRAPSQEGAGKGQTQPAEGKGHPAKNTDISGSGAERGRADEVPGNDHKRQSAMSSVIVPPRGWSRRPAQAPTPSLHTLRPPAHPLLPRLTSRTSAAANYPPAPRGVPPGAPLWPGGCCSSLRHAGATPAQETQKACARPSDKHSEAARRACELSLGPHVLPHSDCCAYAPQPFPPPTPEGSGLWQAPRDPCLDPAAGLRAGAVSVLKVL